VAAQAAAEPFASGPGHRGDGERAAAVGAGRTFSAEEAAAPLSSGFGSDGDVEEAAAAGADRTFSAEEAAVPFSVQRGTGSAAREDHEPASLRAGRMFCARGRALPSWVGLLALLEDFVDTWDRPEAMPRRRAGSIYAREGWRCFAPGCTSRRNLEDHHLQYRSRGGDPKSRANRLCLCRFHHQRGEHGILARCRGRAPLGVLWRLGREDVGVRFRNERRLDRGKQREASGNAA
jgi:hypothetical protein